MNPNACDVTSVSLALATLAHCSGSRGGGHDLGEEEVAVGGSGRRGATARTNPAECRYDLEAGSRVWILFHTVSSRFVFKSFCHKILTLND